MCKLVHQKLRYSDKFFRTSHYKLRGAREPFFNRGQGLSCNTIRQFSRHPLKSCRLLVLGLGWGEGDLDANDKCICRDSTKKITSAAYAISDLGSKFCGFSCSLPDPAVPSPCKLSVVVSVLSGQFRKQVNCVHYHTTSARSTTQRWSLLPTERARATVFPSRRSTSSSAEPDLRSSSVRCSLALAPADERSVNSFDLTHH